MLTDDSCRAVRRCLDTFMQDTHDRLNVAPFRAVDVEDVDREDHITLLGFYSVHSRVPFAESSGFATSTFCCGSAGKSGSTYLSRTAHRSDLNEFRTLAQL